MEKFYNNISKIKLKKKNKILVVGGTGFIGHNLIKKLKNNKKYLIYSLSHLKLQKFEKFRNVVYLKADLGNSLKLKKVLNNKKFDYVINCAGYIEHKNIRNLYNNHYMASKNLYNYFKDKKLKSFVHIGSSSEYGNKRSPQVEKTNCNPQSVYGLIKLKATNFLIEQSKKNNFPIIILRFYQIYGPYQRINRFIPMLIDSCLKNKSIGVSHGKQKRDFLYIDDAVDAILKSILLKHQGYKIINIGSGKTIKLINIMRNIKKKIGGGKFIFKKIKLRKDEPMVVYPDTNNAKKLLKWKPKISFTSGLQKTINFYRKYS